MPQPRPLSLRRITPFVAAALVIGGIVVVIRAATSAISLEAETGALSSGAKVVAQTGASGGQMVQFTSAVPTVTLAPSPTPTPASNRSTNCAPAAAATLTNTVSHLCGFPDVTTTGVPAGTNLKRVPQDVTSGSGWHWDSRGWVEVDGAGAVIEAYDVAGNIDVQADNVTVRNNRVTGISAGGFGVSLRHTAGVTVSHNEIHGANSSSGRLMTGVKDVYSDSTGVQVLANNIYYISTGVQLDAGLVQDNYIHDMGYISGDHTNGTTSNSGTTLLTLRHNTVFNQLNQTDAISLFQDFGVQANRVIDNNLVAGGSYAVYGGQGATADSNIKLTNNHFSRIFYSTCGSYGPVAYWNASGSGNLASGNVWDDTGAALTP